VGDGCPARRSATRKAKKGRSFEEVKKTFLLILVI
jgi:hypothetical protein